MASDNALANWTDQAAGNEQGPEHDRPFRVPTQEALNDAHVSLYPLDASQLTSLATDASLKNNSVQLNPAIQGLDGKADLEAHEAAVTDGRAAAQMRQDVHAVQPAIQQLAQATGGRSFPRADDMVGDLSKRDSGRPCLLPAQLRARYSARQSVPPADRHGPGPARDRASLSRRLSLHKGTIRP